MARCEVCFRHCEIKEGALGFCGARTCQGGKVVAANYGKLTGVALDPIEKKPLQRFYPGSWILSVGSYGCNLRCPFCQNFEISWSEEAMRYANAQVVSPQDLAQEAKNLENRGNIGLAFTYNEPLVGYEYVRDTARLVKEMGMKTVLVSNGTAEREVLEELLPYIDAMNIDLKGFTPQYYRDVLGGDLEMVKAFIQGAVGRCHIELTTLVVPGLNDSEEEMRSLASWVSGLRDGEGKQVGREIPLHISRFFPRFHLQDRAPTPVRTVYRLRDVAGEYLSHVYTGNC